MWTWDSDFLPKTTNVASDSVSVNPGDFQITPDCGSRMTGDCHVRFCESGRGRFPPATHQVPKTHPHPLTSTFAYLQLVLKAARRGPKSVLNVSSDG